MIAYDQSLTVELWNRVFDLLPIEDILVLEGTSRRMKELKDQYCRSIFSLSKVVTPFLETDSDMLKFENLMKKTNAVISGSTALQFFDRTFYPNADLDLYFESKHLDAWKAQVIAFGYVRVPKDEKKPTIEDDGGYPGFAEIETLETFSHKVTKKVIQLMATKALPIRAILDYHSTCVMNMITHDCAYSLYPVSTFIQRETVVCGPMNKKALTALEKYKRRGWTAVHAIRTENFQCAADELKMRRRRLGDDRCWMMKHKGEEKDNSGNNITWLIRLTKYAKTERFVPRMEVKEY
ncbi:hypothetical protein F5887DRAFT_921751 [Amanita rubescens]|nr:hypothetical protein F5887DRAFT_921751 [Amanita rubescens]